MNDEEDDGEFGAGFDGKSIEKPSKTIENSEKPDDSAKVAEPVDNPAEKPEYVQISAKDWEEVRAAAQRTASYDQQLSKAFGTIGNLQKLVNGLTKPPEPAAAPPVVRKVEIPREAFAALERDFPELAQQTRAALEVALSGMAGTAGPEVDAARIESMLATYTSKREIEALEDTYPTWREIVGAVDVSKEQPDPENPFRKWLATKDDAYQARVNGTESAAVIGRAIRLFQNETKAPPKPAAKPRDEARAERIRAAVQPRGDGAGAPSTKSDDDEFLAGFNSR